MTWAEEPRGAAPVGLVADLAAHEAAAVRYARLWLAGPDGQAEVWTEMAGIFGPAAGRTHLRAFERMISTLLRHGRRPFAGRPVGCPCLGGHESALARLVGAGAEANREEAVLLAAHLVRPDLALALAAEAEAAGLMLRRARLRSAHAERAPAPVRATRH